MRGRTDDERLFADLVAAAPDGIALLDSGGRYRYVNPEGERVLGQPWQALVGRPAFVRPTAGPAADPGVLSGRCTLPSGAEVEYEAAVFGRDGGELRVLIFRDAAAYTRVERRLMAFANAAASVACSGSLAATLERVAAEAVRASCVRACQVFLVDAETLSMRMIGTAGHPIFPSDFPERFEEARRRGADLRTLEALRTGETQVSRGRTCTVLTDPAWEPLRSTMAAFPWDTYVSVPLTVRDRSLGVLNAFYPPGHDPSEAELSFLRAMCDQAAIAVENARLLEEAEDRAAWEERQRIARELHDSVCQSLFSLSLRVRALQLAIEGEWPEPGPAIRDEVAAARRLAQATLAEMRSLVLELRPEVVTELGLVPAVRQHATAVGAREGLRIEVRGSLRARLADETVGDLYRICQEALNNIVKHASATAVDIVFSEPADGPGLVVEIRDDGSGFDVGAGRPGRLGLIGMRERAHRIGADLRVQSRPGHGTCVRLEMGHPLPAGGVAGVVP